jgi:formate hydrogenlyase subunit 6/NADH:ubiquinone oxidoreductase subunit I
MTYYINPGGCIRCGVCVTECPVRAVPDIEDEARFYVIDSSKCTGCGMCAEICPTGAIEGIPYP